MNIVRGKLRPIRNHVLVSDMSFEEQQTSSGIIIQSDDGKTHGVKPRWAQVWAVGPEQTDVKVGEWIYVEHGRWTRGIKVEYNETQTVVRKVDADAILLTADERPNDVYMVKGIDFPSAVDAYRLENQ